MHGENLKFINLTLFILTHILINHRRNMYKTREKKHDCEK